MADPITNEQLAGKVVQAVTAVQDAELTVVEEGKKLVAHMADPNAHGQDVGACIAQAVGDHEGNADAHGAMKAALEAQIGQKADVSELSQKADKDTLTTELAQKVNTSALETALVSKADVTELAKKADKTEVDALSVRVDGIEENGGGVTVISIPIITGSTNAPIGFAVSYTVSAASALQNCAITAFRYTLGTATEQTAIAASNTATISITVPAGTTVGTKLTLSVTAVDSYGNERNATKELTASAASVNAPTITSPAAGAIVSAVSIPLTGAGFSTTGATDTQKRRRGRVCASDGTVLFTGAWVTGGDIVSLTLAPSPALNPKASVTVQLQAEGNALGESPWSAPVGVTVASVAQPSITSPANNAEVSDTNITVVTGAMALTGGIADTFVGADYTLYDTSGGVVASAKGIASTSHVFMAPAVSKGVYYDIGVVQHSQSHEASLESVRRRIKIKTIRHGEILYDISGAPAAVITGSHASNGQEPWTIRGKKVWLAVALAAKRGVSISWHTSSSDLNGQDITAIENPTINWQLANSATGPDNSGTYVTSQSTEAHMDGSLVYSQAVKDSKALTDAIRAFDAGHKSAKFCRELVLNDLGVMDLPRVEALMRIYQMRDKIDALDPTANANTSKKLANWGFGSSQSVFVWASSENNLSTAWGMTSTVGVGLTSKHYQCGVIPILEIPA